MTQTETTTQQDASTDNAESEDSEETPQEADGEQAESANSAAAEHAEPDDTDATAAQEPTQVSDIAALHGVFDVAEIHRLWAERRQPYEAAAQTIVPFGWTVAKRWSKWANVRYVGCVSA
ncbi:MAG: hypothetical protein HC914_21140 [Chloroflexaceae bacterium]|nr:hypothetical protein [Chloroflexaceae bacterium]